MNDQEKAAYLKECVEIVPEAIQEEMCRVPADLAYWGERYAESLEKWKLAKLAREHTEAKLFLSIREMLIDEGSKKPTLAEINSAVQLNPEFEESIIKEVELEAAHLAAKNRFWAVSAKKDLVQSLGAQLRTEMERDPLTRESVRAARQQRQSEPDYSDDF